jgi:hypothetical protein
MTDLIQRITEAIFRQEGMPKDYDNPGNLRACPWLPFMSTAAHVDKGFWHPGNRQIGIAGAAHVVALHVAEGNTLAQLVSIWAPASDHNNTAAYIANVKAWAQIPDENTPLWSYLS